MFEVEIKKVTFTEKNHNVSTVDTFYFDGFNAYEEALGFSRRFNKNMPFHNDGYTTAWKPIICQSFSPTNVIIEAFNELKTILEKHAKNYYKGETI